jgi:hypothetical protein
VKQRLERVLGQVRSGRITVEEALSILEGYPFCDLDFAKVDHHRELLRGIPEVVFAPGKTPEQIVRIAKEIVKKGSNLLVTRLEPEAYRKVRKHLAAARYDRISRTLVLKKTAPAPGKGRVAVVSAGTSDVPVAEEAAVTSEFLGNDTDRIYDVGVAGLHRLIGRLEKIREARVIITVAGMEGALPSVVAGLVKAPIIAVPTSVGYGASFRGLAALLAMLNSCPGGVSVVNIDNGFGAAYIASLINHA